MKTLKDLFKTMETRYWHYYKDKEAVKLEKAAMNIACQEMAKEIMPKPRVEEIYNGKNDWVDRKELEQNIKQFLNEDLQEECWHKDQVCDCDKN